MRKVKTALIPRINKLATLAPRGSYIAARKSRVPYSKPFSRWLLKRLTAQPWLPLVLLIFSCSIAR
jgi:hypothetical protein